ncbi:hypothetical protein A2U01_0115732, partial [Trifolium medium]|nr:hypothetical protein [Trifolium medium]
MLLLLEKWVGLGKVNMMKRQVHRHGYNLNMLTLSKTAL